MPQFAANLSMMYQEHAFLDRFEAAARDGFRAVEFLFPYEHPAADIRARLDQHGLKQALFNAPPGDWAGGERGYASIPGREDEFRRSIDVALEYAAVIGNDKLHVMAGYLRDEPAKHRETYVRNLAYAAELARTAGVMIVIEPINHRDMPGYFLYKQDQALDICRDVGAANLRVQFDFYHCQIVEGDLAMRFKRSFPNVGHIQIAGVPDRHEPDQGEINYPYLFELIDSLGYDGWIGCEYRPRAATSDGLGWVRPYLGTARSK